MRYFMVCCACSCLTAALLAKDDDWSANTAFSFSGDYLYMRRGLSQDQSVVTDVSITESSGHYKRACYISDLVDDFWYNSGFQVGLNYLTQHTTWDLNYLRLEEWSAHCSYAQEGSLFLSAAQPSLNDYQKADAARVGYTSAFQKGELNFYRYVSPRKGDYFSFAWLVGLQGELLEEKLNTVFTKGSDQSHYSIRASNWILGVQGGWELIWNATQKLSWEMILKLGVGVDFAHQKTFLGDNDDTYVVRNYRAYDVFFPFLMQGDITVNYQWLHWLNLHAGYQFIYLNGVATAPDQLVKGTSRAHVLKNGGVVMIYGLVVGMTLGF